MSRPVIGITLDSEAPGGYSPMPWYALRRNYAEAVAAAGGVPVLLPHHPELADEYLSRVNGLVIPGGAFDIDPALFGAGSRHASVTVKAGRTEFELALLTGALARDLPVLGICGGEQLINVALGGSLVQHIPDAVPHCLAHEQPNPRDQPGHGVELVAGTRLAAIAGVARTQVNSTHHQAVDRLGAGVVVNALAPDGVVEGIEAPARRFCIGVQWHPEYHVSEADARLFRALTEACR
ncbi:MAG: gamma-glutamyl-gamma-aminobutyrate hydrolase family protein [Actinomycetota bacterium]